MTGDVWCSQWHPADGQYVCWCGVRPRPVSLLPGQHWEGFPALPAGPTACSRPRQGSWCLQGEYDRLSLCQCLLELMVFDLIELPLVYSACIQWSWVFSIITFGRTGNNAVMVSTFMNLVNFLSFLQWSGRQFSFVKTVKLAVSVVIQSAVVFIKNGTV